MINVTLKDGEIAIFDKDERLLSIMNVNTFLELRSKLASDGENNERAMERFNNACVFIGEVCGTEALDKEKKEPEQKENKEDKVKEEDKKGWQYTLAHLTDKCKDREGASIIPDLIGDIIVSKKGVRYVYVDINGRVYSSMAECDRYNFYSKGTTSKVVNKKQRFAYNVDYQPYILGESPVDFVSCLHPTDFYKYVNYIVEVPCNRIYGDGCISDRRFWYNSAVLEARLGFMKSMECYGTFKR